MSSKSLAGFAVVMQSMLDRIEASRISRLKTSEILGAVTVACLIFVLLVLRWLSA
jgi:hypothetical protein